MSSPFDVAKSISSSIENDIFKGKIDRKDINKFMLMQIFSRELDCVLLVDRLNQCKHVDGDILYHALHGGIQPKRNRYSKWIKTAKRDSNLDDIMAEKQIGKRDAQYILERSDEI